MKVFRQFKMRMSASKMADVFYAVIMTKARVTQTFGVGIYKFERFQNAFNHVDIMMEIEEEQIENFVSMTQVELEMPQQVQLNALSATTPDTEDKNDKG
jgi:hypothetical protein